MEFSLCSGAGVMKESGEIDDCLYVSSINLFGTFSPITLHKKWSFPLRIFSVNATKSEVSCVFGHIYRRNL